jgi:hypothetical protein
MSAEPSAYAGPRALVSPLVDPETITPVPGPGYGEIIWRELREAEPSSRFAYDEFEEPTSEALGHWDLGEADEPEFEDEEAALKWEDPGEAEVEDRFEGYDPGVESEDGGQYEADHDSGELEEDRFTAEHEGICRECVAGREAEADFEGDLEGDLETMTFEGGEEAESFRQDDLAMEAELGIGETPFVESWEAEDSSDVPSNIASFATTLGAEWSKRRNGSPTPEVMTKWLLDDYRETLEGARKRWGKKVGKGKFTLDVLGRAWMVSRRENMGFQGGSRGVKSLGSHAPPTGAVSLVSTDLVEDSKTSPVAPLVVSFMKELRQRYKSFMKAANYPGHGGGRFNDRGFSLDLYIEGLDDRGFYPKDEAIRFLQTLHEAATAVRAQWRVIYNDFSVADVVNRALGREHVIFVGKTRKTGGRVKGLNWHGPAPLILHFHLDLAPLSGAASKWSGAAGTSSSFSDSPTPSASSGEELFESEELARHAAYEADAWPDELAALAEAGQNGGRPRILTSARLRQAWSSYACVENRMTRLRLFGRWNTPVNPETVDAWRAFERALLAAGYQPHRAWVYNCRQIAGQKTRSLHAYGLAIDIDHAEPTCNVNRPTPDGRAVRFSPGTTKDERCHDVRRGVADTSFTAEQIATVEAIQTVDGHQVFAWGGRWRTTKDTMHFQINVTPAELARGIRPESVRDGQVRTPTEHLGDEVAEESPQSGPLTLAKPKLPLVLAGPIVRRAQPDAVWFWIACSEKITNCTPVITVYNRDGSVNVERMALEPAPPRVIRLGERLWVALVVARPKNQKFKPGLTYGYDLVITDGGSSTKNLLQRLGVAYPPFDRPTFQLGSKRLVHGSCRRPGGYGSDASVVFDKWVAREVGAGAKGNRPSAMFLTGDQIYADDVAYPLFRAVRSLADDLFGYDEHLPLPAATGSISTAQLAVNDWRGPRNLPKGVPDAKLEDWIVSARARLTRHPPKPAGGTKLDISHVSHWMDKVPQAGSAGEPSRSPVPPKVANVDVPGRIGFSTEDGQGHLLSFAEFAAMYLLVWNPDLWARYVQEEPGSKDDDTDNLTGFTAAAAAARRLLANMPTYMLFDDHEITDDWNLDGDWSTATNNAMARRIISNGLAAYWAFQGWGNDPDQFDTAFDASFVSTVTQHLAEISMSRGRPGAAARSFDHALHAKYWGYAAPTQPPVLCVDTRTRREFLANGKTIMSGTNIHPHLRQLLDRGGFKRGEPLTIVLPTPFLGHRSMFKAQERKYPWPRDRYEGDYELYGNNAEQRPDLIWFLRSALNPPALVVLSGDVHHGFVIDGLYAGARTLDEIYRGKATWAMRVVQITSSAIKNIKKSAFVDDELYFTDYGNAGQHVVPLYENQYKTMPDGTKIAQRSAARRLDGDLGRKTYVFENHFCLVDFEPKKVDVLFVGDARDSKEALASGQRMTMPSTVRVAKTSVELRNDPATFTPPKLWLQPPLVPMGI